MTPVKCITCGGAHPTWECRDTNKGVAQTVEQRSPKPRVAGSIPATFAKSTAFGKDRNDKRREIVAGVRQSTGSMAGASRAAEPAGTQAPPVDTKPRGGSGAAGDMQSAFALEPVSGIPTPSVSIPKRNRRPDIRKGDRHSPGYQKEYQKQYRARKRAERDIK